MKRVNSQIICELKLFTIYLFVPSCFKTQLGQEPQWRRVTFLWAMVRAATVDFASHPSLSDLGLQNLTLLLPSHASPPLSTTSPVVVAIVCFWQAREHHLYGCCHLGLPGIHTALGIQAGTGGLPVVSPPGLFKWRCSDLLVFYPSIFQAQWCGTSCQVESNVINYTALIVPALHLQQRRQETPLPGTQQNNENKEQLFNSSASTTLVQ